MTTSPRPIAYISGPLQAAPDLAQARRFYELLAEAATVAGTEPYLPHLNTDPVLHNGIASRAVFRQDYEMLRRSSVLIADIGSPSSGVGAELGVCHEHGIPVIALHRPVESPSRFVDGMLRARGMPVLCWRSETQCVRMVQREVAKQLDRWAPARGAKITEMAA